MGSARAKQTGPARARGRSSSRAPKERGAPCRGNGPEPRDVTRFFLEPGRVAAVPFPSPPMPKTRYPMAQSRWLPSARPTWQRAFSARGVWAALVLWLGLGSALELGPSRPTAVFAWPAPPVQSLPHAQAAPASSPLLDGHQNDGQEVGPLLLGWASSAPAPARVASEPELPTSRAALDEPQQPAGAAWPGATPDASTWNAQASPDGPAPIACGQGPTIWLVSTRCARSPRDFDGWQAWRYDGQHWQPVAVTNVCGAHAPGAVCWSYIHGNNNTAEDAAEHGLWVLEQLVQASPLGAPDSFVIWSWPSEREPGKVRDNVQIKADVAEQQAPYLVQFLDRLGPQVRVGLVGHSYGARLATAALHVAAGGSISSIPLGSCAPTRLGPVRLAMTGAALDFDWLVPGRRHGRALAASEEILVVTNPADSVLRLYPRLFGRGGPPALGAVGSAVPPEQFGMAHKLFHWNVGHLVGAGHLSRRYLGTPPVAEGIAGFLCGRQPAPPGSGAPAKPIGPEWHLSQQPTRIAR